MQILIWQFLIACYELPVKNGLYGRIYNLFYSDTGIKVLFFSYQQQKHFKWFCLRFLLDLFFAVWLIENFAKFLLVLRNST